MNQMTVLDGKPFGSNGDREHTMLADVKPNYALERSVTGSSERAAGARTIVAPAARWQRWCAAAQRGR